MLCTLCGSVTIHGIVGINQIKPYFENFFSLFDLFVTSYFLWLNHPLCFPEISARTSMGVLVSFRTMSSDITIPMIVLLAQVVAQTYSSFSRPPYCLAETHPELRAVIENSTADSIHFLLTNSLVSVSVLLRSRGSEALSITLKCSWITSIACYRSADPISFRI